MLSKINLQLLEAKMMLMKKSKARILWNSTRYAILLVTLLALTFAFGNSLIFTFTVICMTNDIPKIDENGTARLEVVEMFSQNEKGLLYSAIAIGAVMGAGSIVTLVKIFGARQTFTCYGIISAICTLLSPSTANYGFTAFFIVRIIQGFGTSVTFASVGYVSSAWSPLSSTGLFLSLLTTYVQLAPLFTMPTSAMFCVSSSGWPGVYYLHGALTLIFFSLFFVVYRDSPKSHSWVSDSELAEIQKSKSQATIDLLEVKIPYLQMLQDKIIAGILLACFGNFLGYQVFQQFAPVYLNKVIGLSVETTGFSSALPYILTIGFKFVTGPMSDKIFKSQLRSIQFFTIIPHVAMVICLIIMTQTQDPLIAQVAYSIFMLAGSFDAISFYKAAQFVAGPFASVIMTWFSLLNSFMILVLPIVVTTIARNDKLEEWALIFYVVAAILAITTLIYHWTSDIQIRPWAMNDEKDNNFG